MQAIQLCVLPEEKENNDDENANYGDNNDCDGNNNGNGDPWLLTKNSTLWMPAERKIAKL